MNKKELAKYIDFTPRFSNQLLPEDSELKKWCEESIHYGIGHLWVSPLFVKKAKNYLKDSKVKIFCPLETITLGQGTLNTKLALIPELIKLGADELETLMNFYAFKNKRFKQVEEEIKTIVETVKKINPEVLVKIIIETGLWNEYQIKDAALIVMNAGADFVKTSLGSGPRGVSERDIELIKETVGDKIGIKAAAGIRSGMQAKKLIELGANRLGITRAIQFLNDL